MVKKMILCVLAVGLLAPVSARASITFSFTSEGITFPTDLACPDPFAGCSLTAIGTATATSGNLSPLPGPWAFSALFSLAEPLSPTTFRTVGVFSFDDPSAANNDFSGIAHGVLDVTTFTNSMVYEVTFGSGLFASARGFGSSVIQVFPQGPNDPLGYVEFGEFAIPEPSSLALLGLGFLAMALSRLRRSRVVS